jgi:phage/plasmid-like protein (TIGR03299 family)
MSHGINKHDRMVSANGLTPWHSLGDVVPGNLTPDEAWERVKLNWLVTKHQAFTRVNSEITLNEALELLLPAHNSNPSATFPELLTISGIDLPIDGKFATVRRDLDMPLGVVGGDYTAFQNHAGWDLMKALLSGGDVLIETAGTLNNGRQVWVLVKLDRDLTIGGDHHEPYLLFVWSHDGTTGLRIIPTPVRVVCANTMRMAINSAKSSWSARHTDGIKVRAAEIAETLKLTWAYYDAFEAEVEKLIDTTVTEMRFEEILADVFPDPTPDKDGKVSKRKLTNVQDKRGEIRQLHNLDPTVDPYKGTGWGVVQAFNTHDLWYGRVQGGDGKRIERQASRILTGETMAATSRVRELVLATAN